MLRRLHLANAPRIYRALCEQAEREHWSYHDFLAMLVAEEIAHRQQTRLQRLARKARFPFIKTIEEFDFTFQSTVRGRCWARISPRISLRTVAVWSFPEKRAGARHTWRSPSPTGLSRTGSMRCSAPLPR